LRGLFNDRWEEDSETFAFAINSLSGSECITKKVKRPFGILLRTICVLAVNDLGLLRVQLQLAFRKPLFQRLTQLKRLCLALAMTDRIVGISLERNGRILSSHPTVEDVVKKQICKHGTNHCPLWCSSVSRNERTVRHAHRRLQPSLQIEKYPFAVGVAAHGQHQKTPADFIEEALDI